MSGAWIRSFDVTQDDTLGTLAGRGYSFCRGDKLKTVVYADAKFFAWLKIRDIFSTQTDCIAGLGVAAYTRGAVVK